jgi:glyceraldehyde-3-phosphate dehydrogenase (NADP+)
VVLAITPFNDPLNLVAHKLGPAIAGGNAVILKPATVTPLSALKLTEALLEAGLPADVLQALTGYGAVLGDALVADPRVRMVSFTGGVEAGERIMSRSAQGRHGARPNSPSSRRDADLEWAAETCVRAPSGPPAGTASACNGSTSTARSTTPSATISCASPSAT